MFRLPSCSRPILRVRYTHTVPSIVLRPYQEACIQECIDWLDQGATRIGVSLPTGSGKTTVFISLLSRLAPPENDAKRAIVVVNSVELARQSAAQASRMFPQWTVEIEQGANHKASGFADFTVATYQTLLNPERLAKFDPKKLRAIIVDEAHHAAAPSYRKLLSHFHADIRHPDPDFVHTTQPGRIPVIGFSATFSRQDGLALGSVFERIVYHRDVLQMIKEDWLCNVQLTSVHAKLDLKQVALSKTGDFVSSSLARVMNTEENNALVVRTWLDRARDRKSTLIFCVDVQHVLDLTNSFRERGVDARFLTGRTPVAARKELVASFRAGEFPVLLNCAVLTEGADIPNIDCVIVARPTRSKNIFAQMIGRGMRLSPDTGKEDCHIIDYVDTVNRMSGIMSVPTLFGLDPMKLKLQNTSLTEVERQVKEVVNEVPAAPGDDINPKRSITYIEHGSLDELCGALKQKEIGLRTLTRLAWVTCKRDLHVLQTFDSGKIGVSLSDDDNGEDRWVAKHYRWVYYRNIGKVENSRILLTASTLEGAIRGADTWIKEEGKGDWARLHHSAPWRRTPATEAQIKQIMLLYSDSRSNLKAFLAAVGLTLKEGQSPTREEMEDRFKLMKKGQLFDAIVRLKHKADKYYSKEGELAEQRALKLQKIHDREKKRDLNETVSVGPLCTTLRVDTPKESSLNNAQ